MKTTRRDFLKAAGAVVAGAAVGLPALGARGGEFLGIPDPSREVWTDRGRFWVTPPTHHEEAELVVPERLVSWCSDSPYTCPLNVDDYVGRWALDRAGRAVNWLPATGPLAVWQGCRWEDLAAGDIVRWRNPDGTFDDRISVVLAPAVPIPPEQGYWQVQVDEFRNGYRVKGFVGRFRWVADGAGEVWLVPEGTPDEHFSKGGTMIALYRVNSERKRAVMHWDVTY
jgi:hypothetical protein